MAAVLAGFCYARHILGIVYRPYDDEGYLLLAIDHYLKGGHLFTEVFSQYGPFYFYAQGALFRLLHLPVNHDTGRLVTLVCWQLSALSGGYFVFKVTKDWSWRRRRPSHALNSLRRWPTNRATHNRLFCSS